MKKILTLVSFALLATQSYCQMVIKISKYLMPVETETEKVLAFEMPYDKSDIIKVTGDTIQLRKAGEFMVDVVCTDYPSNLTLTDLNNKRAESFLTMFPYINRDMVATRIIYRQTDGNNKQAADTMFHGIVVRYRAAQTRDGMQGDIVKLERMIEPAQIAQINLMPLSGTVAKAPTAPQKTITDKPGGWYTTWFKVSIVTDGSDPSDDEQALVGEMGGNIKMNTPTVMSPDDALEASIITKKQYRKFKKYSKLTITVTKEYITNAGVVITEKKAKEKDSVIAKQHAVPMQAFSPRYPLKDSTLFKIFKRYHWKNVSVVGDVTSSMYPYIGQLLLWLRMNTNDTLTNFTFFNDGDDMPDYKKVIGKTGGVYSKQCHTFDEVNNLVTSTMKKGSGGDIAENDIEALIQSEKAFPNSDYQILIADNWAPIKDISIMDQLTKPVQIILCGTGFTAINPDYLNLARKTNGAVHLIEQDLNNLASLHEGEVLQIGNFSYKVINGQFMPN